MQGSSRFLRHWTLFAMLVSVGLAACGARPAHFANAPPARVVADNAPIPLPRRPPFVEPVYLSELYLRRPLLNVLEPRRAPRAGDVNAWDEVVRSSWFAGISRSLPFRDGDGPPRPPFRIRREEGAPVSIEDARGVSYRLYFDAIDKPATTTSARLIASRLVRLVGYHTPATWLVLLREAGIERRAVAMRWPLGIDLGPTSPTGTRSDDANDRVAHEDRRTLRALPILLAWLDVSSLGASELRDVYVGAPGRGHVHHLVVGLDGALGARRVQRSVPERTAAGTVQGNVLVNLVSLGLLRPEPSEPEGKSLSVFPTDLDPRARLSRPFAPADRLRADDGYWMAKRLLSIDDATLTKIVAGARLDAGVARHVLAALSVRRDLLARHWLNRVTPLELEQLDDKWLILRDQAVAHGLSPSAGYRVGFFDEDGEPVTKPLAKASMDDELALELPKRPAYLIVRVRAVHGGSPAPRDFEVHVLRTKDGPRVVGMRH